MQSHNPIEPISDEELQELDDFLNSEDLPSNAMTLDMLDGFFTAIHVAPELILPSQWMPLIWDTSNHGEEYAFESQKEAEWVMSLFIKLYQRNGIMLRNAEYVPLCDMTDIDDTFDQLQVTNTLRTLWANGFIIGLNLDIEKWKPLFDNETLSDELLGPITTLSSSMRQELKIPQHTLDKSWDAIPTCLMEIKNFWMNNLPQKKSGIIEDDVPLRGVSRKNHIGRNAPCSCGSGKKYKHCCGK